MTGSGHAREDGFRWITRGAELQGYVTALKARGAFEIALDFEGEFNVHEYGERLCLMQVYDGRETVLIDPFGMSAQEISGFLGERSLLKVMYDSASDQALVRKQYGSSIASILDLKPAVELLEMVKQDLSSVMESMLGVTNAGKGRYQMYNWTLRPVDSGALRYATGDVLHLLALRDSLLGELARRSMTSRYILENLKVQNRPPQPEREPGLLRSGRFQRLSRDAQRRFRRLFEERDAVARELNLPPNTVLANSAMFDLVAGDRALDTLRPERRVPQRAFDVLVGKLRKVLSDEQTTPLATRPDSRDTPAQEERQ